MWASVRIRDQRPSVERNAVRTEIRPWSRPCVFARSAHATVVSPRASIAIVAPRTARADSGSSVVVTKRPVRP